MAKNEDNVGVNADLEDFSNLSLHDILKKYKEIDAYLNDDQLFDEKIDNFYSSMANISKENQDKMFADYIAEGSYNPSETYDMEQMLDSMVFPASEGLKSVKDRIGEVRKSYKENYPEEYAQSLWARNEKAMENAKEENLLNSIMDLPVSDVERISGSTLDKLDYDKLLGLRKKFKENDNAHLENYWFNVLKRYSEGRIELKPEDYLSFDKGQTFLFGTDRINVDRKDFMTAVSLASKKFSDDRKAFLSGVVSDENFNSISMGKLAESVTIAGYVHGQFSNKANYNKEDLEKVIAKANDFRDKINDGSLKLKDDELKGAYMLYSKMGSNGHYTSKEWLIFKDKVVASIKDVVSDNTRLESINKDSLSGLVALTQGTDLEKLISIALAKKEKMFTNGDKEMADKFEMNEGDKALISEYLRKAEALGEQIDFSKLSESEFTSLLSDAKAWKANEPAENGAAEPVSEEGVENVGLEGGNVADNANTSGASENREDLEWVKNTEAKWKEWCGAEERKYAYERDPEEKDGLKFKYYKSEADKEAGNYSTEVHYTSPESVKIKTKDGKAADYDFWKEFAKQAGENGQTVNFEKMAKEDNKARLYMACVLGGVQVKNVDPASLNFEEVFQHLSPEEKKIAQEKLNLDENGKGLPTAENSNGQNKEEPVLGYEKWKEQLSVSQADGYNFERLTNQDNKNNAYAATVVLGIKARNADVSKMNFEEVFKVASDEDKKILQDKLNLDKDGKKIVKEAEQTQEQAAPQAEQTQGSPVKPHKHTKEEIDEELKARYSMDELRQMVANKQEKGFYKEEGSAFDGIQSKKEKARGIMKESNKTYSDSNKSQGEKDIAKGRYDKIKQTLIQNAIRNNGKE